MEYLYTIIVMMALYVILASSFDFVIGHGGLISIAHPIFYALGAYASALLAKDLHWPIVLAIPAGAVVAMVASVLVALPALRVSGDYLLIASIGFQLGVIEAIKNLDWTGGAGGLSNIPGVSITQGHGPYVIAVVLIAIATVALLRFVAHSPYGRAISALRDDEPAFIALGRNAMHMKIGIFALGSAIAGLAGGLYAHYFRFLSADQFGIMQSAALLTMVVVGGMRSIWGPVLGAIVLEALPQALTFLNLPPSILGPLQGILFTGLVLIFMFFRPQGLIVAGDVWTGRRNAKEAAHVRRA
ncbi:MAG: branched-chain amino acid ABC transporter permease [Rhodospirillales bacterium]|nr:branched-chain amino acid ABC transporter permease [Rhodospirillales bacterium]